MVLRMRPGGDTNPLHVYAPAFDISVALPSVFRSVTYALLEEDWTEWMKYLCRSYEDAGIDAKFDSEDLHGAWFKFMQAVKLLQTDPDVKDAADAFARTGFDQVDALCRAVVLGRAMEYVMALFGVAIKDATRLVEGGTPVREDIQAALAAVEEMVNK